MWTLKYFLVSVHLVCYNCVLTELCTGSAEVNLSPFVLL